MRWRRLSSLVVAVVLTAFAVLLVAGHSRWSGREIVAFSATHGLNVGDVWVLVAWLVGLAMTLRLGFGRADR